MHRAIGVAAATLTICVLIGAADALAKGPLVYHGGPVLTHPSTTYIIDWHGPSGTLPSGYVLDVAQFITDWSGSSAHGVLTQYFQRSNGREHVSNDISDGGTVTDPDPFPRKALTQDEIAFEVRREVHDRGLPEGYRVNYVLLLPTQEHTINKCAWHDWVPDAAKSGKVFYAVVPYYRHAAVCPMPGGRYPRGEDIDNAIDMTSHELSEIATNPWHEHAAPNTPRSWYVDAKQLQDQSEIGDLCRFVYGPRDSSGADVILHGHPYLIQEEWSNADHGCSLGNPGPTSCGHVWGGISNDAFTFYSYTVSATGTSCAIARSVAHGWGKATSFDGPAPLNVHAHGFFCTARATRRPDRSSAAPAGLRSSRSIGHRRFRRSWTSPAMSILQSGRRPSPRAHQTSSTNSSGARGAARARSLRDAGRRAVAPATTRTIHSH
jgi:hypothetical protein